MLNRIYILKKISIDGHNIKTNDKITPENLEKLRKRVKELYKANYVHFEYITPSKAC